ncbi:MAG: ERCC4 domain-containing protein [Nanoarchaeota archaeon]|nr:ERCC4 domain-containing protein [Nanoarchaeota archaeon]
MVFLDIFSKKKDKEKERINIIVDYREKNSLVVSHLISMGFEVEFSQLPVGDYIVQGIAIERKTISDFKSSIINKRIISQLLALNQYPKNMLIIEGISDEDIYEGGIHENAFRGFLLSVVFDYRVPVIFTQNSLDTAKYIAVLARKKQNSEPSIRASRILMTKEEQIQFILEGFPYVGPKTAKRLLEKFGSINGIVNASMEELEEIIGKRAKELKDLVSYISSVS